MIRDNQERAKRALIFLYITGAITLISIPIDIWQYDLITNHIGDLDTISYSDNVQFSLALVHIGATIGTIIAFIHWFRRAYYNLHVINPSAATLDEGWAAGGWFVPVLHWWRPYTIMKEIWYGTHAAYGGLFRTQVPGGLLGVWWGAWVAGGIVNNISSQLQRRADSVGMFQTGLVLDSIGCALSLVALGCIVAIIRRFMVLEAEIAELGAQPTDSIFAVHRPLHIEEEARENTAE